MSLLLNGAKTMTIAGTEMQCLEIYTGEAYTFPLNFTDSTGNGNSTPNVALANSAANSTLVIVTLTVSRTSNSNVSLTDINREPLGFIVRYQ